MIPLKKEVKVYDKELAKRVNELEGKVERADFIHHAELTKGQRIHNLLRFLEILHLQARDEVVNRAKKKTIEELERILLNKA